MITAKQAEARRRNGRLSRGPKTAEGKAVSSKNAVKFGFFSRDPVLPGEDLAEFSQYRTQILHDLGAEGPMQRMLADKIATVSWRLNRLPAAEAGIIETQMYLGVADELHRQAVSMVRHERVRWDEADDPEACQAALTDEADAREQASAPNSGPLALGLAFLRDAGGANAIDKLSRSEMLLNRIFFRSLRQLQRLQEMSGKRK